MNKGIEKMQHNIDFIDQLQAFRFLIVASVHNEKPVSLAELGESGSPQIYFQGLGDLLEHISVGRAVP